MPQAQLEDIVPRTAISRHLAELAHLYEATSPVLANLYALIAPLSPESLPQSASGRDRTVDEIGHDATCHCLVTNKISRGCYAELLLGRDSQTPEYACVLLWRSQDLAAIGLCRAVKLSGA